MIGTTETRIFISVHSHRARDRVFGRIGAHTGYWSMDRASYGFYLVTADELAALRGAGWAKPVKGWTRLRPPYDDLGRCWV